MYKLIIMLFKWNSLNNINLRYWKSIIYNTDITIYQFHTNVYKYKYKHTELSYEDIN